MTKSISEIGRSPFLYRTRYLAAILYTIISIWALSACTNNSGLTLETTSVDVPTVEISYTPDSVAAGSGFTDPEHGTTYVTEPIAQPTQTPPPTPTVVPTETPVPTAIPTAIATAVPTVIPTAVPSATVAVLPTMAAIEGSPVETSTPTPDVVTPIPQPTPELTLPTTEPTVTPIPAATTEPAPTNTDNTKQTDSDVEIQPTPSRSPSGDSTHLNPAYAGEVKAVRLENGLVLPVRNAFPGGWQVVTPCFNVASVEKIAQGISGDIDILIDPGHGGSETGAVGPNGLVEADINYDVAVILEELLRRDGYNVMLTRYSDSRIAIQTRADLANALNPKIFVSIHHNGGPTKPFADIGTEIFTQHNNSNSSRLGALIFEEITAEFANVDIDWVGNKIANGSAWRLNKRGTDLYGILRRTPSLVTVLTEAMYLTNPAEAKLLSQPETPYREAQAIARAINRYFKTEDQGSGTIDGFVFKGSLGSGGGTDGCQDPDLD